MTWILPVAVIIVLLIILVAATAVLAIVLARRVVMPGRTKLVTIHATEAGTVTLTDNDVTTHLGEFGLWFGDTGHARIGRVITTDPLSKTVTREVITTSGGDLATATEGRWSGHVIPHPNALEREVVDVTIPVENGIAPAWLIRPDENQHSDTWAIHIHGIPTTRITALRTVPATDRLGYTSLVVSFRGDTEGPPTPGGASTLGTTEWADVEAAISYALTHGARRVVLIGWSMGASIALLLTERSMHKHAIAGLVLIAPATDWRAIIRSGAKRAHLPQWLGTLAILALHGKQSSRIVGLPCPIDFDALDWTTPGRLRVPTLVIHSNGDKVIPLSLTERFAMANSSMVTVATIPDAAHAWEYNIDTPTFEKAILTWCNDHITTDG